MPPPMTTTRRLMMQPVEDGESRIEDRCSPSLFSILGFYLLLDHFGDHLNENRIIIGAPCAYHPYVQTVGDSARFYIQIVKYLYVIADKADGRNHDLLASLIGKLSKSLADVRFKPGLRRLSAAALVSQRPRVMI